MDISRQKTNAAASCPLEWFGMLMCKYINGVGMPTSGYINRVELKFVQYHILRGDTCLASHW